MFFLPSAALVTAALLHLGVNTRTVYGLDPVVAALAVFWFAVVMVVVWRRR